MKKKKYLNARQRVAQCAQPRQPVALRRQAQKLQHCHNALGLACRACMRLPLHLPLRLLVLLLRLRLQALEVLAAGFEGISSWLSGY